MDDLEKRYTVNPFQGRISSGDVWRFADATRFHLRSAHQIAAVMFVGRGPSEESVEQLLKQLEVGLPPDALSLLRLPISLGRGEYLALRNAGIKTLEELWATAADKVAGILGKKRAAELDSIRT